jgi:ABC-type Fe3+ transport system permease subunit
VLLMDVWHWTPLVALLAYAGLRSIPDAYYQAARIDGASKLAVFRYIQLPKMRGVLMIAVLLRFMDSFMIYTEPFVLTGGGPGNATTFLSQYLTQKAVGQFDLGVLADLFPHHPAVLLRALQLDATPRPGREGRSRSCMSTVSTSARCSSWPTWSSRCCPSTGWST